MFGPIHSYPYTVLVQITMGDEKWIYERYRCTSKNNYGHVTAIVDVEEASEYNAAV